MNEKKDYIQKYDVFIEDTIMSDNHQKRAMFSSWGFHWFHLTCHLSLRDSTCSLLFHCNVNKQDTRFNFKRSKPGVPWFSYKQLEISLKKILRRDGGRTNDLWVGSLLSCPLDQPAIGTSILWNSSVSLVRSFSQKLCYIGSIFA